MNNIENKSLKAQLIADFELSQAILNGKSTLPIHQLRDEAMKSFDKLGFPTIRHEEWKYSNVSNLIKQTFDFHTKTDFKKSDLKKIPLPHLKGNVLYFINGVYNAEISEIATPENKLKVIPFSEVLATQPELIEAYFGKYANYETDAFTALNTALSTDGVVVQVADNKVVEEPIIIRFISDVRLANVGSQPRNLIIVGKNSQVKIAEAYRTVGDNAAFVNTVTEIIVGESAIVDYYKVQSESDKSYHIGTTQVYQKTKSYFYSATATLNGGFVRNNLNVVLDGEHIESHLYGLYVPNGRQHIDNHTVVDHQKPNCESHELYKGILMDKSTGVFNGKIFVREDAQKTNAYQNCRNVVTSDEATMNTKPQLEIWADDVKCSHGTTTGQLNDDALFYMQARGISKDSARALLTLAFAQDVIDKFEIVAIKEYLQALIEEKIYQL